MNKIRLLLKIYLFIFQFSLLFAQFSGSIQSSYQLGNLPDEQNSNRSNLYNQLNLQYNQNNFTLGLRAESYLVDEDNEYKKITQKFVRFNQSGLQITAGNFYDIIGRGVLLRSYEIPGSIYEDGSTRQRYAFYKDIEGLSLHYMNELLQIKLIYGRALDNVIPPAFGEKNRRSILVQGGEINLNVSTFFQPGIIFIRSEQNGSFSEYGGLNAQGFFENGFQYYAEYSQDLNDQYELLQLGKKSPHGFYSSFSYSFDFVSTSFEYKDYNRYSLIFNDPPPLVREHSYSLLNRSTHAIEPENETGYQVEFLLNIGDFNTVTLNHSSATNDFGNGKLEYYAYYADLNYYLNDDWVTKIFIDLANDDLLNERDRITLGVGSEDHLTGLWSYNAELQYQYFDRDYRFAPAQNHSAENILVQTSVNHAPDFSFGITLEQSKDPLETNTLFSGDRSKRKNWLGFDLSYQYNQNNTFSLFYGERRGGNACTGGICYQVQPFKGIEFRVNSRF